MKSKRPNVVPIKNPTLFAMEKIVEAGRLVNALKVERPYDDEELLLGTSAFTANGWPGSICAGGDQ